MEHDRMLRMPWEEYDFLPTPLGRAEVARVEAEAKLDDAKQVDLTKLKAEMELQTSLTAHVKHH